MGDYMLTISGKTPSLVRLTVTLSRSQFFDIKPFPSCDRLTHCTRKQPPPPARMKIKKSVPHQKMRNMLWCDCMWGERGWDLGSARYLEGTEVGQFEDERVSAVPLELVNMIQRSGQLPRKESDLGDGGSTVVRD